MTRRSFQRGFVSMPIRTRQGIVFKIRYRVPAGEEKWKHRTETLYGLSGRKEARSVLEQRLQELSTSSIKATDLTLKGFAEAYWKPYLDRRGVKPSTRASYMSALRRHILPTFGDVRMTDLSPLHIEELLQKKLKSGLSAKSVRNLLVLLQGIFALAVDNDLVTRSPVRNRHKPTVTRCEKPIWSADQVRSIIEKVPESYRPLFVCVALTGVRLGELLGLQWKHVDLSEGKLRIEQSLWHGSLVPPKTAGSIRTIPFGQALANAVKGHFQQSQHRGPEHFVFCKADGSPLHPDVLRKDVLYPALDGLGIPRPKRAGGFHTFRHSVASFIASQTGNLKLAQKLLGHSNLSTTANVYTHTFAEEERKAALAVERAIYGDLFPIVPKTETGNKTAAVN